MINHLKFLINFHNRNPVPENSSFLLVNSYNFQILNVIFFRVEKMKSLAHWIVNSFWLNTFVTEDLQGTETTRGMFFFINREIYYVHLKTFCDILSKININ
jgi:hypothetical protein